MPNELYRDFIDGKADEIINSLGGTITPAPANAELYRDFLDRKFDDVITAIGNLPNIKSFTYTGTGGSPNTITFPIKPKLIIAILGVNDSTQSVIINSFVYGQTITSALINNTSVETNGYYRTVSLTYNDNEITLSSKNGYFCANVVNKTYTVYYI